MKVDIYDVTFIISMLLAGVFIGILVSMLVSQSTLFTVEYTLSYEDVHSELSGNVNGFYSPNGFFCVLTKDRSPSDVARTTFHELAHYYVDYDTEHFVGKYLEQQEEGKE